MANKKITELDAITSASTDDILPIVDAPGGSAATKKITFDNLQKSITTVSMGIGTAASNLVQLDGSAKLPAVDGSALTNLPAKYIMRSGDPSTNDYTTASFTKDSAWHDLDLSTIVPAGTVGVVIKVVGQNNTNNVSFSIKPKGTTNTIVGSTALTVANVIFAEVLIISCDANRFIQYFYENTGTWTSTNVSVIGYFK
jgi:hypothetical protein